MKLPYWLSVWRAKLRTPTKTIRRTKMNSRRARLTCETLEDRKVPSTFANTFSVTGVGQFDGNSNTTTNGSYCLGGNFDTGNQSIGGISSDFFGVDNGAKASFNLSRNAGVNLGYQLF
jgi:hypothetical protein